jgi:hypothetical protein
MTKEEKKRLKNVLANKELTRSDARWLMLMLFNDSYFELSKDTFLPALWIREQFTAIKIFTKDSQEKILQAAFARSQKKPKIVLKKD